MIDQIAREYGITVDDLTGPSRRADVVAARWNAIARLRAEGMKLEAIGREVHRSHATVLHALKKGVPAWC